jgi:hypothetical protein
MSKDSENLTTNNMYFDMNNLYALAEQIQDLGFHGNFPTREDYQYESDRDKAKEFVKKHFNDNIGDCE